MLKYIQKKLLLTACIFSVSSIKSTADQDISLSDLARKEEIISLAAHIGAAFAVNRVSPSIAFKNDISNPVIQDMSKAIFTDVILKPGITKILSGFSNDVSPLNSNFSKLNENLFKVLTKALSVIPKTKDFIKLFKSVQARTKVILLAMGVLQYNAHSLARKLVDTTVEKSLPSNHETLQKIAKASFNALAFNWIKSGFQIASTIACMLLSPDEDMDEKSQKEIGDSVQFINDAIALGSTSSDFLQSIMAFKRK